MHTFLWKQKKILDEFKLFLIFNSGDSQKLL